jgi:hypothetical protein
VRRADRQEGHRGRAYSLEEGVDGRSHADVLERLEALERSLRGVVQEISATRRSVAELLPAAETHVDAGALERRGPAGAGAARASMRHSPLDVLFRSTVSPGPEDQEAGRGSPEPEHGSGPGLPSPGPSADEAPGFWLESGASEKEPQRAAMLATRERLLGLEHPDTQWAAHDLALALADAGEIALAWRLATRLLGVRTSTLGTEHPDTARAAELQLAIAGLSERTVPA